MENSIFIRELSDDVYLVVGFSPNNSYPDPYEWVCTAKILEESVHFYGFLSRLGKMMRLSQIRAKHKFFKEKGCKTSVYQRIKDSKQHIVVCNL